MAVDYGPGHPLLLLLLLLQYTPFSRQDDTNILNTRIVGVLFLFFLFFFFFSSSSVSIFLAV